MTRVKWWALCFRVLSVAAFLAVIGSPPAQAQVAKGCAGDELEKPELADWLGEFYAKHAQPILGAEQRLANGVAWRVVTDGATRLAVPRITWMPDREAMQKANRFLEALHGCAMVTYYGMAGSWFGAAKDELAREKHVSRDMPRDQFIWQPTDLVALTYATPSLMSLFEVRVETGQGRWSPMPVGQVLDLRRNELISIEGCGDDSLFRFGGVLKSCDDEAHARFLSLWDTKLKGAIEIADRKGLPDCRADTEDDTVQNRVVALYLTVAGLAIYKGNITPYSVQQCMLRKSPTNPVIIPYRELAPFMKPGPWRDELLK